MNLKIIILITVSIVYINRPFNSLANENKIRFNNLKYRNVGPTRGGRVTSVHGVESLKYTFYMGTTRRYFTIGKVKLKFIERYAKFADFSTLDNREVSKFKSKANNDQETNDDPF